MSARSIAVEIFCSYTPEDKDWLDKLETHLSLLKRQKLLSLWHNRLIAPGADWATAIDTHLETASVILLLVSADFFASEYCFGVDRKAVEKLKRYRLEIAQNHPGEIFEDSINVLHQIRENRIKGLERYITFSTTIDIP